MHITTEDAELLATNIVKDGLLKQLAQDLVDARQQLAKALSKLTATTQTPEEAVMPTSRQPDDIPELLHNVLAKSATVDIDKSGPRQIPIRLFDIVVAQCRVLALLHNVYDESAVSRALYVPSLGLWFRLYLHDVYIQRLEITIDHNVGELSVTAGKADERVPRCFIELKSNKLHIEACYVSDAVCERADLMVRRLRWLQLFIQAVNILSARCT